MRRRTLELVLLMSGCVETVDTLPPLDPASFGCSDCHGTAGTSAPPRGVDGRSESSLIGVGAHAAHVRVSCVECHVVPMTLMDLGHVDTKLPAEVVFGAQPAARWERTTATCSNTTCHGTAAPKWTEKGGPELACTTCHGMPPRPPHVASMACDACHAPVAGPNQTIADPTRHADGIVDVLGSDASCASRCHGSSTDPMPPPGLDGASATTALGVGAHLAHQTGGLNGRAVACSACHLVPVETADPGHVDTSTPAEVRMIRGTWDRASATCSGTGCHLGAQPVWTRVDGSQATCSSCHGFPPASHSPSSTSCGGCHPTAGPGTSIERSTHGDGVVQL